MGQSGGQTCSVCGCVWNKHMHVTYEMIPVDKPGEDEATKQRYKVGYYNFYYMKAHYIIQVIYVLVQGITDRVELKKKMLNDLEERANELNGEKEQILKACAYFGLFLQENSVLAYNDAMISYLNLMIKQEREKAGLSQVIRIISTYFLQSESHFT